MLRCRRLTLLAADAGKVDKVELVKKERGGAVLRVTMGAAQADVKLRSRTDPNSRPR